ncbi:MAG: cobalamin biosynthesis protein CobD [Deltaproteobacteria bacterium]|nr:cobalamin biosynthesis protein CobD [Deltaproteobacteria bacterium]
MMELHIAYALLAAFVLDLILGDPLWLFHPVRWMGTAISRLEPVFRRLGLPLVISGTLFCGFLVLGVWGLSWLLVHLAGMLHPTCRSVLEAIIIYYCISPSSLRKAAMEVDAAFTSGGLPVARKKVSRIVGRETAHLSEQGVVRAAVETVAENLVDGIISPLFYAAIGGAPLAMAYRMVNTLDSMVGYRNNAYLHFGKASARLDDIANFIPARLAVPVIAFAAQLLSGNGKRAFQTAVHEGGHHASPNSGYSEAAFAGALSVKLNGPGIYHGHVVNKPYIGIAFGDVTRNDIHKACDLMLLCSFLWITLLALVSAVHP